MKTDEGHSRSRRSYGVCALALVAAMIWGSMTAEAQQIRIRYRPLSPQEIKDLDLPETTQRSGGAHNAGIGQPIYLEALVQAGAVVSNVNWLIIDQPTNSTAVIQASPLGLALPTYDAGDRIGFFVAGRALFVPDVQGIVFNPDYTIRTDVVLTNQTLSVTNIVYGSVYLGQKHYLCVLCHADKQAGFDATAHATAFTRQISGEGSPNFAPHWLPNYTLGYDTTPGATNAGFDDVAAQVGWTFPTNLVPSSWTSMPSNLQHKANIQCENCHGPADRHMRQLGTNVAITVSLSAGNCGQCHDNLPHHVKIFEWSQANHATNNVFRTGSCGACHSSVGFINAHDPTYAGQPKTPRGTYQEGISCAVCHDPHTVGMGASQLRDIPSVTLMDGTVATTAEAGMGILCMNCHKTRRNAETYVLTSAGGPHYGAQGDMLIGANAIHYGKNMPTSRHMLAVENSCVGCHMQYIKDTSYSNAHTRVGGHTFRITWDGDSPDPEDTIRVTEVCSRCHVEQNTFDFGGEDYDGDGVISGVQTEVKNMLTQLAYLLPPVGQNEVSVNNGHSLLERRAAYNYQFVKYDGSYGVHNPKYATALLRASIDDMLYTIDPQDELPNWLKIILANPDMWDSGGPGLPNWLDFILGQVANLWYVEPEEFADLAEYLAQTSGWTTDTNAIVQVLPAIELGYAPDTPGQPRVFQAISALPVGSGFVSGGWQNAGPVFVTTNEVHYQLISTRNTTQMFFRVAVPEP